MKFLRRQLVVVLLLVACGDDEGSDSSSSSSVGSTAGESDTSGGSATASTSTTASTSASTTASTTAASTDDGATGETGGETNAEDTVADTSGNDSVGTTGDGVVCSGGAPACDSGETCRVSACCRDVGVCVPEGAASCGGFVGEPCPDGLACLLDACVADGDGVCVEPILAQTQQAELPMCWMAG